jgi:SAM-dependent methyltransferase
MSYQSFDDRPGGSKSNEKLARIKLPADLTNKRVLDLGCNEGFFCIEAKKRGAAYVLGIDRNKKSIEAAKERAARENLEIDFLARDFLNVPAGKFDVILMLSALHYANDPKTVLRRVLDHLAPFGTFILECGIADQAGRRMRRALRAIDERYFPSLELLRDDWLEFFSVRPVGRSVPQAGDPIPRTVFHCVRRKPTVVFVHGPGSIGKTSICRQFNNPFMIETDAIITPRRHETRPVVSREQQAMDEALAAHGNHIGLAWDAVRSDPEVVRYFAGVVSKMILLNPTAKLILVEGVMVADLVPHIMTELKNSVLVWNLAPGVPVPREAVDETSGASRIAEQMASAAAVSGAR